MLESVRAKLSRRGFSPLRVEEIIPIAGFLVASLLALIFGFLAEEVTEGDTRAFDRTVLLAFRQTDHPSNPIGPAWLAEAGRDVTSLGSYAFLGFLLFATIGYLLLVRKRGLALLVSASVIGGMLISTLLKISFHRARPDIPHAARVFTTSFPSGHATVSAVAFLTLGVLLARASAERRLKFYFIALAIFLTIAVGVSRVYLGLHYPSDVLAGWCIGSMWAILCWTCALLLERRYRVASDP